MIHTAKPEVLTTASGTKIVSGGGYSLGASIDIINYDSTLIRAGDCVMIGNAPIVLNKWDLAARESAVEIFVGATLAAGVANTDYTIIGVAVQQIEPTNGKMYTSARDRCRGIVAGHGSVVMVRCNDAVSDVPLTVKGSWVGMSDSAGAVQSYSAAASVASANAGHILGRVVQPAGNAAGATGSNFFVGVLVMPR